MSGCSDVATQEQILTIDRRVTLLSEQIAALRVERNTFIPIARLPNELLSKVFKCYLAVHMQQPGDGIKGSWCSFSHVCHRWRQVSIHDASMWTHIGPHNIRWATELLLRSKSFPLTVDIAIGFGADPAGECLPRILSESRRLRELSLSTAGPSLMINAIVDMAYSADTLESLKLTMDNTVVLWLPNTLFRSFTPCLRRLNLFNCGIQWDSPLLSNLTDISISFPAYGDTVRRSTLGSFLERLQDISGLKRLRLEYCVDGAVSASDEGGRSMRAVHLRCLESLQISDDIVSLRGILKYLRVPATASITLACISDYMSAYDMPALCRVLRLCNDGFVDNRIQHLVVDGYHMDSGISVIGDTSDDGLIGERRTRDLGLELFWTHSVELSSAALVVETCCSLYLTDLRTLKINAVPGISQRRWVEALFESKELQQIHICGMSSNGLVDALVCRDSGTSTSSITFTIAPVLRRLLLEDVRFSTAQCWREFCGMARLRASDGLGLERVVLTRCSGIDGGDIEDLRVYISDLEWDGIENAGSEANDEVVVMDGRSFYGSGFYSTDGESDIDSDIM